MVNALIAVLLVSLISLVGFFTLGLNIRMLKKVTFLLVSLAVGALFGDVFFHLLPEVAHNGFSQEMGFGVIVGILIFFGIEKFVHWRHCHEPVSEMHTHPLAIMNVVGDGLHNFLDGFLIAASFAVSPEIGIATTIAVALHELPQEIADFGVLVHAGLSVPKALLLNFGSALMAVLGVFVFSLVQDVELLEALMVPIIIGGFLYIAGSDLVPELHKETKWQRSLMQLVAVVMGLALMWGLLALEGEHEDVEDESEYVSWVVTK
ncbi:MAG: hypothetical protein KatS3mg087_0764 [Patescibacteria group bacterium]|nr:MAG: hypothetical protein KatS3mg087_0764 [Patescibacteria group bacterium]